MHLFTFLYSIAIQICICLHSYIRKLISLPAALCFMFMFIYLNVHIFAIFAEKQWAKQAHAPKHRQTAFKNVTQYVTFFNYEKI